MIKLLKFGPGFGTSDFSPFVLKVETYFKMTGVEYQGVPSDVRKAPKKKLPVVEVDGRVICDSSAIIEHFESKRTDKLDAQLDAKSRAIGEAFKSMIEEHFYYVAMMMRWVMDDGWAVFKPEFVGTILAGAGVPSFLRGFIANSARRAVIAQTKAQGTGRHSREEVVAIGRRLYDALDTQLGEGKFLLGDEPSTYDATAWAFITVALAPMFDNELRKYGAQKKNIAAYLARMNEKYDLSA